MSVNSLALPLFYPTGFFETHQLAFGKHVLCVCKSPLK